MTDEINSFWDKFNSQSFSEAQRLLTQLKPNEQAKILEELFQKSEYHRSPFILSVFRAKLKEGESFEDFHQAWLPTEEMCDKVETKGQVFAQHFPMPMRVINAVHLGDPKDVLTVGIGWVRSKEEEEAFKQYLEQTLSGKHTDDNSKRRERNEDVSERCMLGIFQVKADDNLGTPFKGGSKDEICGEHLIERLASIFGDK